MTNTPTQADVAAAFAVVQAIAEAIRDLREVPSGHLYAQLMHKLDLHQYQQVIGILKRANLVEETPFYLLRWIGPKNH